MYPIVFENNWIILPAWHVFFILAVCSVYYTALFFYNKYDTSYIKKSDLDNCFLFCYIGGYFGARGLSILVEETSLNLQSFFIKLFELGSMTFYGSLLTCLLVILMISKFHRQKFLCLTDYSLTFGMLGLAIGRLGCFLNGDDYGIPIAHFPAFFEPLGVSFNNHSHPIARFPVQILSSINAFLLFLMGVKLLKKHHQKQPGRTSFWTLTGYSVNRFLLEFLRDDPRGFWLGLATSQWISLVMITILFALIISKSIYSKDSGNSASS